MSERESSASPQRVLNESLDAFGDDEITPEPLHLNEALDPVDVMAHFIQRLTQLPTRNLPITKDRDRLIITLLLSIIADPFHHLNEVITKPLLKVYLERGGKVYRRGVLSYSMRELDQFDHTVQYLYDYGLPIIEIARAMGTLPVTIRAHLKHLREEDKKISTES